MRLVTFSTPGSPPRPGVELADGSIVAVGAALSDGLSDGLADAPPTVARLLGALASRRGELDEVVGKADADRQHALDAGLLVPAGAARLHAPLGERGLLVLAGANYRSHVEEMGEELPERAAWAVKSPNAVVGPGEPIRLPRESPDMVDFEGELAVVFGRPCHDVPAEEAAAYVGGYTIVNDVSARDGLAALAAARTPVEGRWAWTDMLLAKQYPTFAPLGPAVVTADEVGDPGHLHLTTTVNGRVMQDARTDDLVFGVPELIAQLSRWFSFAPGDVLTTGTPAGVGASHDPPAYLRPGDVVTVTVDGIGALTNPVVGP